LSSFKVACIQNCAGSNQTENISKVEILVREAAGAGAELICLPEFYSVLEPNDSDYWDHGWDMECHPALLHAKSLASEIACWLLLGSIPVKASNRKVYNRSILIDAKGHETGYYDKLHLFDVAIKDGQEYKESRNVIPGETARLLTTPWGSLGLTICYDVRFPALYRSLAQAGASFISIPAAFTEKTGSAHWHTLVRSRAIETGSYIFAPGQTGMRSWGRKTYGHSLIVDPWGVVLADAGVEEGYITAEIDPEKSSVARNMIPSLQNDVSFGVLQS
jgi:predicted amidohydrolase